MKRIGLIYVALCVAALVAYLPSFGGWIQYENVHWIPEILTPVTLAPTWDLAHWSLSLNAWLGGTTPWGYHLVNVGIHCVNGWLVFVLAKRVFIRQWVQDQKPTILGLGIVTPAVQQQFKADMRTGIDTAKIMAVFAAAVFLLHPIQTEAVAYLTGRWELVSTLLVLIALVAPWPIAVVSAVLAMTTKTSAIVVIALFPLVRGIEDDGFLLASIGAGLVIGSALWKDLTGRVPYLWMSPYGPIEYAARQAVALWRMLALVVVPWGQTIDHDWAHVPVLVVAGAIPAVLGGIVGIVRARRTHPMLWLAACWILICVAPRFVVRTPELISEHQMYLPFVGVALLVGSWGKP